MKHSGDPWTASGMKACNKPHEAPVRAFLTRLVADPPAHAKFLNMLSLLEHMGSRKIMVSQMNRPSGLDQDTLQHMAEEARHAYFFKRHAERVAGHALPSWEDDNTHARMPALMYFGRMDAGITNRLKKCHPEQSEAKLSGVEGSHPASTKLDPSTAPLCGSAQDDKQKEFEPYGWVSLIIELRACWLYKIYDEVVTAQNVHLPLKGLLAEEDHHLAEMFAMCGENHDLLRELSAYETSLFAKFWQQIEAGFETPLENAKAA